MRKSTEWISGCLELGEGEMSLGSKGCRVSWANENVLKLIVAVVGNSIYILKAIELYTLVMRERETLM